MPWFHHKSDEEKEQERQAEERRRAEEEERQQTLASLEAGGLPIPAMQRLQEVRARDGKFFTSDLSVAEFLLARQAGLRPITQIMGSSVYHVGWQNIGRWSSSGELEVISAAYNNARQLALGRMEQEAEAAGANVVVGVHFTRGMVGEEKVIEFQAIGTAARVDGAPADHVGLTNLSGQDFWKLYQAGYWPLGVAAGSTVYHAVPTWGTQWATSGWGGWRNQELTDFTQHLYQARHIAMNRVTGTARKFQGAAGLVGVDIEQEQEEIEVDLGNDQERTDMIFTLHVMGTAIAQFERQPQPAAIGLRVPLNS